MQRYRHDPHDDADRRLHGAEEALQEAGMSAETGLPGDVTRPDPTTWSATRRRT